MAKYPTRYIYKTAMVCQSEFTPEEFAFLDSHNVFIYTDYGTTEIEPYTLKHLKKEVAEDIFNVLNRVVGEGMMDLLLKNELNMLLITEDYS